MTRFVQGMMVMVLVAFAGTWLLGQDTKPRIRGTLYPRWGQLGLSTEQRQQIYKIRADYGSKISELQAKIKQLRAEELSKAAAVLTPAQRSRLRELNSGGIGLEKEKAPAKEKVPVKKEKSVKDK